MAKIQEKMTDSECKSTGHEKEQQDLQNHHATVVEQKIKLYKYSHPSKVYHQEMSTFQYNRMPESTQRLRAHEILRSKLLCPLTHPRDLRGREAGAGQALRDVCRQEKEQV